MPLGAPNIRRPERSRLVVQLLVSAAALLATLALLLSYAGRAVLRAGPFADRVTAALRDPGLQSDLADHLTSAVVKSNGDLAPVRPLIRAVAGGVVSTPAFAAVLGRAVRDAHAMLVTGQRSSTAVNVADAAVLLEAVLQRLAPSAAATVGAERAVDLLTVRAPPAVRDAARVANAVYKAAWIMALAALLLALIALWRSDERAAAARALGAGLAIGGVLLAAVYVVGLAVVGQTAPAGRSAAAQAIWRAFAGGLRTQGLWLAAGGVVVAAAASAAALGSERSQLVRRGQELWHSDLARALLAVGLGAALVLEPAAMLTLVTLIAGLSIGGFGVAALLRWAASAAPSAVRAARDADRSERGRSAGLGHRIGFRRRVLLPLIVGVIALAGVTTIIATGGGDDAPAASQAACNGSASLCPRALDRVAFAATHNSFASVTIPGFLFGQQDGTIADQLAFGIRGFLIDTYYGYPTKDGVRTDTTSLPKRSFAVEQLGEPAVKAAEAIRARVGAQPEGPRGIYLCHGFCELGAVPLASALNDLREFMVQNPGAVVIVINQDEGVSPDDIAKAFATAGLDDLLYRGPLGPFPTLGEMVQSDQRLVVMAENDAGSIPWYHLAYAKALQETPFRFTTTAALTAPKELPDSCRPNRGPESAPLFLVNNWVDTTPVPRPSNATTVNAYQALLTRARTCQQIRDRLPNLIAVDFYQRGDVLGVVRTLNGS